MMNIKNKKGQVFDQFGSLAIGVAALAITLVVAFLIMAQSKDMMDNSAGTICYNTSHYWNTTNKVCCLDGAVSCTGSVNSSGTNDAYNATSTLQNATSGIPGWVSIIIITAIGAALIGMVTMFRR